MAQIALITLLILVGSIPISGISQSFAQESEVPDWVKTTLGLWANGEITNDEFVKAIDYLSSKGIVEISSINEKELQREIDYLKAKSEVFQDETKELREENKEYRILLKTHEMNETTTQGGSMSKIFNQYQALQKELKVLKAQNKEFVKQIDTWIANNGIPEQKLSANADYQNLVQVKAEHAEQLNNLKVENKKFEEKISELKDKTKTYQDNIELLKLENQNKSDLITALKERTQENRDSVNQLIQSEQAYEALITQLKEDNFNQKQQIVQYEDKIKSLDQTFDSLNVEQSQSKQDLEKLQRENVLYVDAISELEGINEQQKADLISVTNDLTESNRLVGSLSAQIQGYESTIKTLKDESKLYQNQINYVEGEKLEYQDRISQLEQENTEQRKTLMGIMSEAQESSEFASTLNSRLSNFQEIVDNLEEENAQYRATIAELENDKMNKATSLITMKNDMDELNNLVTELSSKVANYEGTIQSLVNENKMLKNDMMSVQDKGTSDHESLIRQLQGEKSEQVKTITSMKVEIDESNELISSLNSKIVNFENQIKLVEQENSKYRNEVATLKMQNLSQDNSFTDMNDTIEEKQSMVKLLTEQNEEYQDTINALKQENKLLEKRVSYTSNENSDNQILMTEIESENKEMVKQIELLKSEVKQKHEQIETLKDIQMQKDAEILQMQAQKPQEFQPSSPSSDFDSIENQNDMYLVELNYLKAKNLVNDEEIETLRAENEEYRVLLNLLKNGKDSVTGIDNVNYDSMDEGKVQGVVVYNTNGVEKHLPADWVAKVKNSKTYSVYVEPTPRWSADMSNEVQNALEFWKNAADVEFEIASAPSFGNISIGWEKELRNGYDGYVVGQTNVSIGLGSSECDNSWRPYSHESVENILIHELGHTVGLDHAVSKSNIMYPLIHDAKFEPTKQTVTIPQDSSVFIKGCSFSADPSFKYQVEVKDSKKVDIFFVPSVEEKYKVDSGDSFNYYSDINCLGLDKSSKMGICKEVADSGGMLIINSGDQGIVSLSVYLEEQ